LTQPDCLMDCDAIVVNFNAGAFLLKCVNSVLAEGVSRVVVVDNHSTDNSLTILSHELKDVNRVTVVRNRTNLGFARGCNVGIKKATASRLLFLNPDSFLEPGALKVLTAVLDKEPRAGAVGGLLCNSDGTEQPGGRRVFPTPRRAVLRAFGLSRFSAFLPKAFADFLMYKDPLPTHPIAVESISGACMLVKREMVEDVGLWDKKFFLHCEDLDWCMRMRKKGWVTLFVPGAQIIHAWGVCGRQRPVFVEYHKHRGMVRFFNKHFRTRYPLSVWVVVCAGVWVRFLFVAGYHSFQYQKRKFKDKS